MKYRNYYIAIDFDGTLTLNNNFPNIGEPNIYAIDKINRIIHLKSNDYNVKLILWTCREDVGDNLYLSDAIKWCEDNLPFKFDYINENPEVNFDRPDLVRKIVADLYIDDKAYNPLPGGHSL